MRGVRHDSESRTTSTESQKNHESLYKIMNHSMNQESQHESRITALNH